MANLPIYNEVEFRPDTHQYFHNGMEYQGWSNVAKSLQIPFDREGVSRSMAYNISKQKGITFDRALAELLEQWDGKKDSSISHGNMNHNAMEKFAKDGTIDPRVEGAIRYVSEHIFKSSHVYYPEFKVFSHIYRKAGTADLVVQRQKSWKASLFDIYDYKTNEQKGIQLDSVSRKDPLKHYNKFLLPPFDYIEDCNFAIYSLQLCAYAYMLSEMYKIRIGRLCILFIDKTGNVVPYPVLYNPLVIKEIFSQYNQMRPLPVVAKSLPLPEAMESDRYF